MRLSGTLITRAVAKSVVLAFIRTDAPALFQDPRFQCSDSFIRRLLKDWLDWSWRTVTQAAQKLPENHVTRCIDLAHRLTWNIAMHNVPPELVINADQTGISYLGTGRKTWELKGSNQVSGVGKDEKRQFTLMVGVTAAGQILPFQSIFKGSTAASLPSAFSRTPCEDHDFLFTSGGDKHWSSLGSMKQWVTKVLIKHVRREQLRLSLPPTQKAIIVLDCWSVHRGEPFRTWLKTTYPCLILLFIPGGCTGVAQPCDTNVNRILKHLIKSSCVEYLAQETQAQLKRGVKPADVFIDTTVGTLRNASTAWILSAWIWLRDHPETILDAWRQASFGRLNLSYGSLNSPENRSAVHERFHEDIPFALSIVTPSPEIPDDPDFDEDADGPDYDDDCAIDPNILCDIRAIDSQLPAGIVDAGGDFEFAGDEELTDADADGEIDVDDMELDLN
ncbi:hypothetical protein BDV93DRAFT_432127 [Ceratobasidium sp. AG-I]|nr:hypothetical protein BDV93DRAFT_432127 [Ceratobasidium sp. AG-I]